MRRILWALALGITITAADAAPARADSTGNQLSLQRNELRSDYRKAGKELDEVEDSIDESTDTSTISGNATTIWAIRNAQSDYLEKLKSRLKDLKQRRNEILRDYRQLTRKAEDHYGELPMWWEEDLD